MFAVCVVQREGLRGDVFGYPGGIARAAVVGAVQGHCVDGVGDWAGEAILKDAGWVDGGSRGGSGSGEGFGGGGLLLLLLLLLGTGALVVEDGGNSGTGSSTGCCDCSESGLGHDGSVWIGKRGKGNKSPNGAMVKPKWAVTGPRQTCDFLFFYIVRSTWVFVYSGRGIVNDQGGLI